MADGKLEKLEAPAQVCEKQKKAEDSTKPDVEEAEIDKKIENGDVKEDVENGKDDEVDDNEEKEIKSTKRKSGAGDGPNSDEESTEKITPEKKPKLDEEVAEVEQKEEVEAAV